MTAAHLQRYRLPVATWGGQLETKDVSILVVYDECMGWVVCADIAGFTVCVGRMMKIMGLASTAAEFKESIAIIFAAYGCSLAYRSPS